MKDGVRTQVSNFNFDETVRKVEKLIEENRIKLFCVIDHAAEAEAVGLTMSKTKLLIFGNAKSGTPLMVETPTVALDLPLKLLVSESKEGAVTLTWNDPSWLQNRHGFSKQLETNLGAAAAIANALHA